MVFVLWPRADVSARRVLEVIDTEPMVADGTQDAGKPGEEGEIEFRNVSFAYPDSRHAMLEGVNFKAKKGQTVAFIAQTGSGKSSLINLVPRFYDATQGEVLVDGVNVRDYRLKALRDKIGYVPQQSFLFQGTIASNVAYGDTDATTTPVRRACVAQATGIHRQAEEVRFRHFAGRFQRFGQAEAASVDRTRRLPSSGNPDFRRFLLRARLQNRPCRA